MNNVDRKLSLLRLHFSEVNPFRLKYRCCDSNFITIFSEFLRASLVLPNKPQPASNAKPSSPEPVPLPFQDAANNLQTLTSSDAVVIFDLRAFNAAHAPTAAAGSTDEKNSSGFAFPFATSAGSSRSAGGTSYFEGLTSDTPRRGGLFSGLAPGAGAVSILGSVGYDWESMVGKSETRTAISQSLMNFYAVGDLSFVSFFLFFIGTNALNFIEWYMRIRFE